MTKEIPMTYLIFQHECKPFKADINLELISLISAMGKKDNVIVADSVGNLLLYCANFCKDNELSLENIMALSNLKFNTGYQLLFDELAREIRILTKENIQLVVHILQTILKNRDLKLADILKEKL